MNSPVQLSLAEALQQAIGLHQANRLPEAEQWYRAILQAAPDHPDANHNLGLLLEHAGQAGSGLPYLQSAIRIVPDNPSFILSCSGAMQANDPEGAQAMLESAIARGVETPEIWCNLGNMLRAKGRLPEAMAAQQRALVLRPGYALASFNLGLARQDAGDLAGAAESYQQAIRFRPGFAEAHNLLGTLLMAHADPAAAAGHFRAALDNSPGFGMARLNLANALLAQGDLGEALRQGQAAVAQNPGIAAAHHNLGSILRRLNRFGEAEVSYRAALATDPDFVESLLGLASILRYQNHEEAEQLCRRALAIQPRSAEGRVILADLLTAQGRFAQAEHELKEAIAIAPGMAEAWAAIPGLRKMSAQDADWLRQAEKLADGGLPAEKEAYLRFALGKYHDDTANYPQAFKEYRRANELSKSHAPPYERSREEDRVARSVRDYSRQWVCRERAGVSGSPRPIFIVGMPRSGTSLVEQILAAHPDVFGAGELSYWSSAAAAYSPFTDGPQRLPNDAQLADMGRHYLEQLQQHNADAARVVDKMPSNFQFIGLIHAALPNARIIHMRRNPVDTCLSNYFQHFEAFHPHANDLENLAHYYRCYRRLMLHWEASLPEDALLDLPYEALVQDQEAWTRRLLDFLGLPWNAACLEFERKERTIGTASNWQARQKINRNSVERWRRYGEQVGPLLPLLDDEAPTHEN